LLKRYCRPKNPYIYNLYVTRPRVSQNSWCIYSVFRWTQHKRQR